MSLRKVALSTAAMSSVNVLRLMAQILAIPLLARLLSPADYGIIGIAMPFVLFVMLIADSGLGTSLIRTPLDEREEWSTCFWLSAIFGVALALLMAALAPVVAYFYNEPQLTPIIIALAFIIFGQVIGLIPGAALQQAKRFGTIAAIELACIVTSISAAVIVALEGGGVWALVAQQVALYAVRLAGNWYFSPFRPLWVFDLGRVKAHVSFGRDVLGVNLVGFFTRALDNLVIGKVQGPAPVGIYAMAFQFLRLPFMLMTGPLQYVLYSHLAPSKDDKPYVRSIFLLLTRVLAIITFPVMGLIAAAQEPIFHIILSEKWNQVGPIFSIVMPMAALQAVTALAGTMMLVFGRTDIQLRTATEVGAVNVTALLISSFYGIEWVALTYATVSLLYLPRGWSLVLPVIGCGPWQYLRSMALPMVLTCVAALVYKELAAGAVMSNWAHAFVAAGIAFVVMLVSAALQYPALRREVLVLQSKPH